MSSIENVIEKGASQGGNFVNSQLHRPIFNIVKNNFYAHTNAGLFVASPDIEEENVVSSGNSVQIPLLLVSIEATVQGFIAEILAVQTFKNKEDTSLEVVYRFPVEEDAAVTACSAELDGEKIEATIQENWKADKMYDDAIKEKKSAVKLTSVRPDIFEMMIGNLAPGSVCIVTIKYIMELPVEDGKTRMIIPTTIAPKFVTDKHNASVVPQVLFVYCGV